MTAYSAAYIGLCTNEPEADSANRELSGGGYSCVMQGKFAGGSMAGIIPCMGLREFLDKLHGEPYDPGRIYEVWKQLPLELVKNNEKCGVCPVGYTEALPI